MMRKANVMKTWVFETQQKAASYAVETIENILTEKPDAVFCLAAGHTSIPIFNALAEKELDFSKARFIGLDEWVGVPKSQKGSCAYFLNEHFFSRISVKKENVVLFDAMAENLEQECTRMEEQIKRWGGIDYLLLGMGMNGHLALNEPGDDFERTAHVTELSQTTLLVAPKYFSQEMPPIVSGITLGIGTMRKARRIQLAVFGSHKREGVAHLQSLSTPDLGFPATALYLVKEAELLLDQEAAGV